MSRPPNCQKVIDYQSETCYWMAPDGSRHEATAEENAEVKNYLLEVRTIAEAHMRHTSEQR